MVVGAVVVVVGAVVVVERDLVVVDVVVDEVVLDLLPGFEPVFLDVLVRAAIWALSR